MNPTSWKTTAIGVLVLLVSIAEIWVPDKYDKQLEETKGAIIGAGLVLAQDREKKEQK